MEKKQEKENLLLKAWKDEKDDGIILELKVTELTIEQVILIAKKLIESAISKA